MSKKIYLQSAFAYREDTLENWQTANPVLEKGEVSIVRDGKEGRWLKIGDGKTPWNSLDWKRGAQGDIGPKGEQGMKGDKGDKGEKGDNGKDAVIDQTYSPASENAQSGKAVAQALDTSNLKLLKTITLEEDVLDINITFDKGLKEIMMFMKASFDPGENNKTLSARTDGGLWYWFTEILNLSEEQRYFYARVKEVKERLWESISHDTLTTSTQGVAASTTNCRLTSSIRPNDIPRHIKDLNIFVGGRVNKLKAGSTIEIWGVEADENI